MGEVVQIKDVKCCAEDADQETAYETLNISKKEESHYANIMMRTNKPADGSEDENKHTDKFNLALKKTLCGLKILYSVLTIVSDATATISTLIHVLVRSL